MSGVLIWIKLGLIALAVGAAAYFAWDYRGALNEKEKTEAVNEATKQIQGELNTERALRLSYQTLADDKLAALLDKVGKIKATTTVIHNTTVQEVESNPQFYSQPLPAKGYDQWKQARALVASPASLPASAPQRQ